MSGRQHEEFRPVVGFEGLYEVSSVGAVRSYARRAVCVMKPSTDRGGYLRLNLTRSGLLHNRLVHSLVAEAFIGPRPPGMEVRHLDGNQRNNAAENLAYGTHIENVRDSIELGTHTSLRLAERTSCRRGHAYNARNTSIARDGSRVCKECNRLDNVAYRDRQRRARMTVSEGGRF